MNALRKTLLPALAATLLLGACSDSPTEPAAEQANDYALVMFGEAGAALENTMGPQHPDRPFDGRSSRRQLPDSIALSAEQVAEIAALRAAFRAEHGDEVDALRAKFEEARAAREDGATREEVRAILEEARTIAIGLRFPVWELHEAIRAVLTVQQRFWLDSHRPRLPQGMVPRGR